jgi:hypothetical protein
MLILSEMLEPLHVNVMETASEEPPVIEPEHCLEHG